MECVVIGTNTARLWDSGGAPDAVVYNPAVSGNSGPGSSVYNLRGHPSLRAKLSLTYLVEHCPMSFRLCPGARLMLACALVAGASSSAFGQAAPAPAQPPVQVPPSTTPSARGLEPTGPVRQLSIDEAVKLALEQNLGIQIERFNPELQDLNTAQILVQLRASFRRRRLHAEPGPAAQQLPVGRRDDDHLRQLRVHHEHREAVPVGHRSDGGVRQRPADDEQRVFELQPDAERQSGRRRHAAAAAQLQVRHRAAAAVRLAQEPGDRRRRSAADRRVDRRGP